MGKLAGSGASSAAHKKRFRVLATAMCGWAATWSPPQAPILRPADWLQPFAIPAKLYTVVRVYRYTDGFSGQGLDSCLELSQQGGAYHQANDIL